MPFERFKVVLLSPVSYYRLVDQKLQGQKAASFAILKKLYFSLPFKRQRGKIVITITTLTLTSLSSTTNLNKDGFSFSIFRSALPVMRASNCFDCLDT